MGLGAAIELVFSLLALKVQKHSPTIDLESQDPEFDISCSFNQSLPFNSGLAHTNSFGFGAPTLRASRLSNFCLP